MKPHALKRFLGKIGNIQGSGPARRKAMIRHLVDESEGNFNPASRSDFKDIMALTPGPFGGEDETADDDRINQFLDYLHEYAQPDTYRGGASIGQGASSFNGGDQPEPLDVNEDGFIVHTLGEKTVAADASGTSTLTIDLKDIPAYKNAVLWITTNGGLVKKLTALELGASGYKRPLDLGPGGMIPASVIDLDVENDGPSRIPRGLGLGSLSADDRQIVVSVSTVADDAAWTWSLVVVGQLCDSDAEIPGREARVAHGLRFGRRYRSGRRG